MSEFPEQIGTEWLFDAHIDLAPPENIGGSPSGSRAIFIVIRGVFEGRGGGWFAHARERWRAGCLTEY